MPKLSIHVHFDNLRVNFHTLLIKASVVVALPILLTACASTTVTHTYPETLPVTQQAYTASAKEKGLLLVTTSGSRTWGCGEYENAELRSIGFDRQPSKKQGDVPADLIINSTPEGHKNHVFLLEPGVYGISYFSIKAAKSMLDIGYINANRKQLIENGKSIGGSFSVNPGEVVYIGHFALDCAYSPIPWRYYIEGEASFNNYVSEFKSLHPYLNLEKVNYRLFSTKEFGQDYELSPVK